MKTIICFLGFIVLIFSFSFISNDLSKPTVIPEENLIIKSAIDGRTYIYSEKAAVKLTGETKKDVLVLRYEHDLENSSWIDTGQTILGGEFEKASYFKEKLFILMDGKYYVFDLNSYNLDPNDEIYYPKYDLQEYDKDAFVKLYPQYESFDWYGH